MSIFTLRIPALLAAGSILCVAATGMASAHLPGPGIFHATEAMSYVIGSKRAVGYFQSVSGKCQLTLMIAEVSTCDHRDTTPLVFFSSRYHRGAGVPVER